MSKAFIALTSYEGHLEIEKLRVSVSSQIFSEIRNQQKTDFWSMNRPDVWVKGKTGN